MENITLKKINFVNGSSGNTPLNKTNLNQIQQNIENAINEVVPIITGIEENTENNNSDIAEAKINIENNIKNILEINNFIKNSMKTLSEEGTSIHVTDSADYPCQLKVEGKSEQVQTEQSANLADADVLYKDMETYNDEDLSEKTVDGKECIEFKNSLYKNDQGFTGLQGNYKENTQYTVRGLFRISDTSITSGKKIYFGAVYTDDTRNTVATEANGENWTELRILTSADKTLKGVYFTYDQVSLWLLDKSSLCIAEGNVTEYPAFIPDSPSPNYPSEIENVSGDLEVKVLDTNLFMKQGLSTPTSTENFWSNYTNTSPLNSGWCKVEVNNTGTTVAYANQFVKKGNIDKIKPDTNYIIWTEFRNIKTLNTINGYILLCGSDNVSIWNSNVSILLTSISEGKKIIQKVKTKSDISNTTLDLRNFVSVSAGSSVTFEYRMMILEDIYTDEELQKITYEDYSSQSVTFPLGEQKLMKDGYLGENGIVNKRKQIVLTGNETYISEVLGSVYLYEIEKNDMLFSNGGKGLCSHFTNYINNYTTKSGNIRFGWNNKNIYFYTSFPTLEEFKNWLTEQYSAGTPVIVEYEVEKEETTPYTEEQQTAYNELQKLKTYRTVTNVSNNQNTNMKLTYKMDLQTQFQELEAMLLESGV